MSHIALTGANGFLGWHTRAAILEGGTQSKSIALGSAYQRAEAADAVSGATRLVHIAGVNRGTDGEVASLNRVFAQQVAEALTTAARPPAVVVYANSTQSGNGSIYGQAKAAAGDIIQAAAEFVGAEFRNVLLPNLFGEHGHPFYNSVTATFSHQLSRGEVPTVDSDKELVLLHAQDAADWLLGILGDNGNVPRHGVAETVTGLLARLRSYADIYSAGSIPDISTKFDRDLFNTYRSYLFPSRPLIQLEKHQDERGSFFEIVRTHGGTGQSSFSTTEPGVSRGDHFHRRKVERFAVLSGRATIELRRVSTNEVVKFDVDSRSPVAVDMPTLWAHKITNTGDAPLYTSFWTNDIFDPQRPDTIAEAV